MENDLTKIHPDLRAAAKRSPALTFSRRNRWFLHLLLSIMPAAKIPPSVSVENRQIPVADGRRKLRLRIYQPRAAAAPGPVLLWLHGGGYIVGRPNMDDALCALYVQELGITVVSVDYRLAPKHPFPAALDDGYAALRWVAAQGEMLGVNPARLAIGGQSAGGGLAAALVQMAHDRGEIAPLFQLLIYPMLDDRTVLRTDADAAGHLAWNQASNRFGWEAYLGRKPGTAVPAYAVPARRTDLAGLPPAWIGVGTLDLFHDEDLAYAQRLTASSVPCETMVVPGAFHGFDAFAADAPVVVDFRQAQVAALRKYLLP
jgi:acetyl esterase/lipase